MMRTTVAALIAVCFFLLASIAGAHPGDTNPGGGEPGGMGGMGHAVGSRMLRIPLVSPHTSPVQVQRGIVMLATYMSHNHHGMGYGNSAGAGAMVRLLMYGVYDANGLVTADGNHLVVTAKLSTDAGEQDVSIDQTFSIVAGRAYVFAPISLPDISEDAPLEILGISIEDSSGTPFAVPGVVLLAPEPSPTPDAGACTADAECDDGDSDTVDTCTAGQCQHREQGGGMGPGMGPGSGPMM